MQEAQQKGANGPNEIAGSGSITVFLLFSVFFTCSSRGIFCTEMAQVKTIYDLEKGPLHHHSSTKMIRISCLPHLSLGLRLKVDAPNEIPNMALIPGKICLLNPVSVKGLNGNIHLYLTMKGHSPILDA